jgi:hypothetical protein
VKVKNNNEALKQFTNKLAGFRELAGFCEQCLVWTFVSHLPRIGD